MSTLRCRCFPVSRPLPQCKKGAGVKLLPQPPPNHGIWLLLLDLLDQHHPPGFAVIASAELVEVNAGGDLRGIPGHIPVASFLRAVHESGDLIAEEIIDLQLHTGCHRQLILNHRLSIEGIGVVAEKRELGEDLPHPLPGKSR